MTTNLSKQKTSGLYKNRAPRTLASGAGILFGAAALTNALWFSPNVTAYATAKSEPTVVIGYENNGPDPEMVAIAKDYFSKYMHAKVEMKLFTSGPAALTALGSGSLQFMTGIGNPPAMSAMAQGVPLQVIWAQEMYTKDEGLAVKKTSGIKSVKDLKGKTVALVLGSTSPLELDTALKNAGVPASSVHLLNMSPPAMQAAWTNNQIQAAYVWDPVFASLLKEKGEAIMYDANVKNQAPIFNLTVVNTKWAASHESLVEGFIQAQAAGVSFYQHHREAAIGLMAKEAGISVAMAKIEAAGFQFDTPVMQLGHLGMGSGATVKNSLVTKSLEAAAKYLMSSNTITSIPAHIDAFVNPMYVEKYLKK